MEVIDKTMTEGMLQAEKKCQKLRAGKEPFLDKLAKTGRNIHAF